MSIDLVIREICCNVYRYGYKKHVLTNREGIIRQVITTPANRNDLKELIPLLSEEDLPADTPVYADKGYATEENRAFLARHHLRDCIMHKAYRNRPLSQAQHLFNRSISPIRSVIERTFGSIRRWFDGGLMVYVADIEALPRRIHRTSSKA